jgi:alpha-glucosidase
MISANLSVFGRKAGDDWFVGSLTNRDEHTIETDFAFLPDGQNDQATFCGDAAEAHFLNNKESYQIKVLQVSSGSKIKIRMAPPGVETPFIG